ncbi:MAG TPA: HAMP domain-containing sensor histidine kinase [Jatrophihabitantaceae bacterium]
MRVRLIAILIALLLVVCATVGIVTTFALRGFLIKRLDQQLTSAGTRYATALEHDDHDADNAETGTLGQAVGTLGARSLNGTVTSVGVIADTGQHVTVTAADKAVIARLQPSPRDRSIGLPTLGEFRVQVTAGQDGDVLVTGLPLHSVEETLHRLEMIEAIAFAVVLAITGVLGVLAVRWSLRPLSRVASTAMRVSELPLATGDVRLHERVPDEPPSTEVGQVSVALNHMLDRIDAALSERQRSEERLRRFIADASHELRTPLAVIRGHAEFVHRDLADLPPSVAQSLQRIEAESARMGRLVDDLLLLARLDEGRPLDREEVDLTRLSIDAMSDAQAAGPDHQWRLDLPDQPVVITGDAYRLHEVVANLLANARVHTPSGTTVTLAVTTSDDEVRIEVSDNGPGIPVEVQPTVFERFTRADSSRGHVDGSTGLGLAIVAAVVAAHSGNTSVASHPGQTTITVRLPPDRPRAAG